MPIHDNSGAVQGWLRLPRPNLELVRQHDEHYRSMFPLMSTPTRTQALILVAYANLARPGARGEGGRTLTDKERAHHAGRLAHFRGRLGEQSKAKESK